MTVRGALREAFTYEGRLTRSAWLKNLAVVTVLFVACVTATILVGVVGDAPPGLVLLLLWVVHTAAALGAHARRLRDIGISGWWLLLWPIGWWVLLPVMAFVPGRPWLCRWARKSHGKSPQGDFERNWSKDGQVHERGSTRA